MILKDTNIFFDNEGKKTLNVGIDVDFGFGANGTVIEIESPCIIAGHDKIDCGFIGAYTFINMHVTIQHTAYIGRFCSIASDVYIGIDEYPLERMSSPYFFAAKEEIFIGNGVCIGVGAKVMRGIHIGDGAVICAGTVVTKDVPAYAVVGGVADKIQYRFDEEIMRKFQEEEWWEYNSWNGFPAANKNLQFGDGIEQRISFNQIQPVCNRFYTKEKKIIKLCEGQEYVVYDASVKDVYAGGISVNSCRYNSAVKVFEINGWFLPSYVYERVEVWTNKRYLGDAQLHCLRNDVIRHNPAYGDARAGWNFKGNIELGEDEITAVVKCMKDGKIIHEIKGNIFRLSVEALLSRFQIIDMLERWNGITEVSFETDENEEGVRKILQKEFDKIDILITKQAKYRIICKLDAGKDSVAKKSEIPFYYLLVYNKGAIDYLKLKEVSQEVGISMDNIMLHIRSSEISKKMICFYGNCQIRSLNSIILTSTWIKRKYEILSLPPVQDFSIDERKYGLPESVLKEIGIFIYQNVAESNRFSRHLSTEEIKKQLKDDTICVAIPNVYFTGYFPQYCVNSYNLQNYFGQNGPFPYGDINIQAMWDDYTPEEIVRILSQNDFYGKEICEKTVRDSLAELKLREKDCDIRISDYIEKEYKRVQLFYTTNHVANFVLKELIDRVFSFLGIQIDDIDLRESWENDTCEIFIYPSVAKNLNLEFAKDKYCYFKAVKAEPSTMEEYVEDYIYYCKPKGEIV